MGSSGIWEHLVVLLAIGKERKTPGAELVAFSRATYSQMVAIGDPLHEIDRLGIMTSGQGKIVDMRKKFEKKVTEQRTKIDYIHKSIQTDPAQLKTFKGGFIFICNWYR